MDKRSSLIGLYIIDEESFFHIIKLIAAKLFFFNVDALIK
jgi:hypothetical protein